MIKVMKSIAVIGLFVAGLVFNGAEAFELAVDYGAFWVADTQNFIEFYYSFPYSSLRFEAKGETLISRFSRNFYVNGRLVDSASSLVRVLKGVEMEKLVRLEGFGIFKGVGKCPYKMVLSQDESSFSFSDTFVSFDFRERPSLSSIVFASYLGQDSLQGLFYRNGYFFTPNPRRVFGRPQAELVYVYLEVYNLTSESASYEVTYTIKGKDREWQLAQKKERAKFANFVLPFSFSCAGIPAGNYLLSVTVRDLISGNSAKREKDFIVEHKETPSPVTKIPAEEEEVFFLIATDVEKARYKRLSEENKAAYLAQYFKRMGACLRERLSYVDEKFGKKQRKSDRARVVLKYGIPPEVEVHPFKENVPYHEHWRYPDKSYHFIFMCIKGEPEPILLWSNVRGERNYPGWERYIDPEERDELR